MTFFLTLLFIGSLAGLLIGMIVLLVLERKNTQTMNKLTYPAYEYVIKKAEHDAEAILNEARGKARSIIAEAEKEGQKTIEVYKNDAATMQDAFAQSIDDLRHHLSNELAASHEAGMKVLAGATAALKDSLTGEEEKVRSAYSSLLDGARSLAHTMEEESHNALTLMEQEITKTTGAITDTLQKEDDAYERYIDEHLEAVVKAAEEEIRTYRDKRIALLDSHIERLVEDVVKEVLHLQLTPSQHADLARDALMDAKERNLL